MDLYSENQNVTPVLDCDGFTLRPLVEADVIASVAGLSQWSVTKWLTSVPWPFEAKHAREFITEIVPASDGPIWAIDEGGVLIGSIGADPDLGYWLHPDYHGRGIMTRAAGRVVDYVFEQGAAELISGYIPGNAASCGVLTKLGFQDAYLEEVEQVATGEMVTLQRVVLTREGWEARHG